MRILNENIGRQKEIQIDPNEINKNSGKMTFFLPCLNSLLAHLILHYRLDQGKGINHPLYRCCLSLFQTRQLQDRSIQLEMQENQTVFRGSFPLNQMQGMHLPKKTHPIVQECCYLQPN